MVVHEHRLSEFKEILLGLYGIKLGIPALSPDKARAYNGSEFEQIATPYKPHVFFVQRLDLWRREVSYVVLRNVMVIVGHGILIDKDQTDWRFAGTNKPVEETVRGYDNFAKNFGFPPIDVVLSCRGNTQPVRETPGIIHVHRQPPIIISRHLEAPHIHPTSLIKLNSSWRKEGKGVEGITANSMNWQKVEVWQDYWKKNSDRRSKMIIPSWAKEVAR